MENNLDKNIGIYAGFKGKLLPWISSILFAVLATASIWVLKPFEGVDNMWSDYSLAPNNTPVSNEYVVISINQQDLINQGKPSLDRADFANAIEKIHYAGANRLLLDYLFSGKNNPDIDTKLANAIALFPKDKIAFGKDPDPLYAAPEYLSNKATLLNLNLLPDDDTRFRNIRIVSTGSFPNPAIWLNSGKLEIQNTPVDIRLNPNSIRRVSYTQLVNNVSPDFLKNKNVILSYDKKLSMTRMSVPVRGEIDRGGYMVLGAQSYEDNYYLNQNEANYYSLAIACFISILGFAIGATLKSLRTTILGVVAMFSFVIITSNLIVINIGSTCKPASAIAMGFMGLYVAIAHRLRLYELFSAFMAGNLSPEEVWLWRSHLDKGLPVILFDANRGIKKLNGLAMSAFTIENVKDKSNEIGKLCLPNFGERSNSIITGKDNPITWQIEWPHHSIPIAVFKNISEEIAKEEQLHKKLITDPMTGQLNRLGFNNLLAEIDNSNRKDYAIFYIDMNGFKEVNDTYGHDAGDELLIVAGKRFAGTLRENDKLARLGGDEFAIIAYGELSLNDAAIIAEKLKNAVADPIKLKSANVNVGAAIGYALPISDEETTSKVVERADKNMFKNKAEIKGAKLKLIQGGRQ